MSYCWPSGGQRGILMQWVTDRDISISNIDKIFHIYWQTSTKLFVHQLPQYFIYTKPSKSLFWPFLLETIQSNHLQTDININTGCRYFVGFFQSKLENLGEPKTKLELHCGTHQIYQSALLLSLSSTNL